jgi:periplasmic divalent cation tolerance protein
MPRFEREHEQRAEREGFPLVRVTAPEAVAEPLARRLIGKRVPACVNIVPAVRSIDRWQGHVEEDAEVLSAAKTDCDRVDALSERVRELHPYDLPERLALPAVGGSPDSLGWVNAETR